MTATGRLFLHHPYHNDHRFSSSQPYRARRPQPANENSSLLKKLAEFGQHVHGLVSEGWDPGEESSPCLLDQARRHGLRLLHTTIWQIKNHCESTQRQMNHGSMWMEISLRKQMAEHPR